MSSPTVVSRTPQPDETNVYLNQLIYVVFDQDINVDTVNDNTVVLYRISDYQIIDKTVSWETSNLTLTITPDVVFDQNSQYNVVVVGSDTSDACIKNSSGESLTTTATWYFTTGLDIYQAPLDSQPEIQPEKPTTGPAVSPVLHPLESSQLSIVSTYPENYSANTGTQNGDYETSHFDGPITITFNRLMASGVAVQQDWVTLSVSSVDGDPSTVTALPTGTLSNANGYTLTWTPSTVNGNDYTWRLNNEIIVTVSKEIEDYNGVALGTDFKFMFTTPYRPFYCTVQNIRSYIGSFLREIPDDTIARNIYFNSLETYNIANTIYSQYLWNMDSPTFPAQRFTCCKTQYDLLHAKLLDMASVGPGQIKRLGDFTIQESTDIQAGIKSALSRALECSNAWMKLLIGKYRRAKTKMAVKGVASPATPPMRGVRTWTLETGRDTLGANKTLTRRIKSPGIYSDWS